MIMKFILIGDQRSWVDEKRLNKSRLHQQVSSGSGGGGSNVKVSVLNSRSFDNQAFHARCLSNHICCSAIFTEERANKNH